jgi:hypothetical protein
VDRVTANTQVEPFALFVGTGKPTQCAERIRRSGRAEMNSAPAFKKARRLRRVCASKGAAGTSIGRSSRLLPRRATIFTALAAWLIVLGAIFPALARDGGPTEATPASDAASTPAASSATAPTIAPAAPATEASTPIGGPKTFSISEGASESTTSGWFLVAPAAAASGTYSEPPAATVSDALASRIAAPAAGEQIIIPDDTPLGTEVIPSNTQQALDSETVSQSSQVVSYEPQLHSRQEFMNEEVSAYPLGLVLQEGARRTSNGLEADGLLVVELQPDSPAGRAGVCAGHPVAHDMLEGAAVVASLVFPPAVLVVPVIETIQLGENYDLIIGVDGTRVTNFMEFEERLRDAQPGETVYLNILRADKRLQIPVEMPQPSTATLEP